MTSSLTQIEAICKVEGLDGVLIGPNDLGINIGHRIQGAYDADYPPGLATAIDKILKAVKASGKTSGIFCANGAMAKRAASQGFDFVSINTRVSSILLADLCRFLWLSMHICWRRKRSWPQLRATDSRTVLSIQHAPI